MTADKIENQMSLQMQKLQELKAAQKEGDARLGREADAGSPRGVCARMRRVRDRMCSIFPDAPQVIRAGSWMVAPAARFWHAVLGRVGNRLASEPVPKGWPPSWPVLMPRLPILRRAWKQRFGEVMADVETLNAEGKKRNDTAKQYQGKSDGLAERLEKARRLEMRAPRFAQYTDTSAQRSALGRMIAFLRRWCLEVWFGSKRAAPEARPLTTSVSRVVTVDGLVNENVVEPIREEEVGSRLGDLANRCRTMLEHIDIAERETLREAY